MAAPRLKLQKINDRSEVEPDNLRFAPTREYRAIRRWCSAISLRSYLLRSKHLISNSKECLMNFSIIFCVLAFVNIVILISFREAATAVEVAVQVFNGILAFFICRYGLLSDDILREFKVFSTLVLVGVCVWLATHNIFLALSFGDSWLVLFIYKCRNIIEK